MKQERCFYSEMNTENLISYCDMHSETPRALFRNDMVAQMVLLAGEPKDWLSPEELMKSRTKFYSLKADMKILVEVARKRLNEPMPKKSKKLKAVK